MLNAKLDLFRRLLERAQASQANEEGQGGVYIGGGAVLLIVIVLLLVALS